MFTSNLKPASSMAGFLGNVIYLCSRATLRQAPFDKLRVKFLRILKPFVVVHGKLSAYFLYAFYNHGNYDKQTRAANGC